MRQGRGIAVAVTVAVAGAFGAVDAAMAQIQLVPQGRPGTSAQPSQQQRPPAFRPTNRPEAAGPDAQRGNRRRGQTTPPASAAPADPNATSTFPRRLDQRTIRTRFFDGQPINARALGGGLFTLVFHEDGRMERTAANGQVTTGRWRFVGDAYCSRWDSTAPAAPATTPPPPTPRQRGQRGQGQPAQRSAPETCHTVVQEGTTIRVVRNTRAVATWAREGTPPPP
jgi:hypothetical protein